jgi:secreted trypsin-like serine protease
LYALVADQHQRRAAVRASHVRQQAVTSVIGAMVAAAATAAMYANVIVNLIRVKGNPAGACPVMHFGVHGCF